MYFIFFRKKSIFFKYPKNPESGQNFLGPIFLVRFPIFWLGAILDNWNCLADEEIVVCLERLFNPCTYLSATGEGIVTEQQVTDIKTAVTFFNKDPTIDWSWTDMKTEYTTFVERVAEYNGGS